MLYLSARFRGSLSLIIVILIHHEHAPVAHDEKIGPAYTVVGAIDDTAIQRSKTVIWSVDRRSIEEDDAKKFEESE